MDPSLGFAQLLGIAQQKQQSKSNVKQFSTKVSVAKKDPKDKKLSANVQKFLDKKEQEEKQKKIEEKLKLKQLVESRTDRQKNKIRKHLKVTKSSNKAVLDEAVDDKNTVDTLAGRTQCDEDDYGYESKMSNSIYEKLMNKFEANPDDPMAKFSRAAPKQAKDISTTMDRVKNALKKEEEEAAGPRKRKRKSKIAADDGFINDVDSPTRKKEKGWLEDCDEKSVQKHKDDSRDKKQSGERNFSSSSREKDERERRERDKREREKEREKLEASKRRLQLAKKAPPPLDFQALMKAAAEKKGKPVQQNVKKKEVKEQEFGGRPMTNEQKEEFRREEERRLRREGKLPPKPKEPNGRIPKNASATSKSSKPESSSSRKPEREPVPASKPHIPKKPQQPVKKAEPGPQFHPAVKKSMSFKSEYHKAKPEPFKPAPYKPPAHYKSDWKGEDLTGGKKEWGKEERKFIGNPNGKVSKSAEKSSDRDRRDDSYDRRKEDRRDDSYDRRKEDRRDDSRGRKDDRRDDSRGRKDDRRDDSRGRKDDRRDDSYSRKENYRSSDSKKVAKPQKSKIDIDYQKELHMKIKEKPDDGKRRFDPSKMGKLPSAYKRRIESDSDDEYDSELDDFIDDAEDHVDIGKEIRSIFGYDKRRFRDEGEFDDRSMENNKFSHIMMEEAKSAKIGKMEDLADMRREEEEKKRKMGRQKR